MSIEKVIEKISADARIEAQAIIRQARQKEDTEQSEADRKLNEYKRQTENLAQKAGHEKKAHLLAAARMELAKEYLAEKKSILDEVFAQAKTQLQKMPAQDYLKIMTKLMLEAVETGDQEVILDEQENRIDHKFIDQINQKIKGKGNLRLAPDRAVLGGAGFILKRGNIKTNASLKVILDQARKDLEIELAGELFK